MSLQFTNVEKRLNDSLVFPAFNLHIDGSQVTAIHSSLNVTKYSFTYAYKKNTYFKW